MGEFQNLNSKSITLAVKEFNNQISLTCIKNCLNGYKIINLDQCDSSAVKDWEIMLKNITTDISKITYLTLSHCDLTDIPYYISDLLLKNLDISHNLLKFVPSCILKGLKHLEILDLSCNYIKEFETEPQCIENLQVLNLTDNKIFLLPFWILTMRSINLTELYYSYNQIGSTQELKFDQENVCKLKKLELKNCSVLSDNIQFIKSRPLLTHLNLSNESNIHRNIMVDHEVLFNDPAWKDCIEVLNLNRLIIAFVPENMCTCVNLKELYLSETDILWLPNYFINFEKLEVLDVSMNSITHLPLDLGKMRNLRVLKVQYNAISSVPDISGLTNLKVLDLYRNELENFKYNIGQYEWIDLEQNLLETSVLGGEYIDKRNSYRGNNDLENRLDGCNIDINNQDSSSYSDNDSVSSVYNSYEVVFSRVLNTCEDENWDTYKSHPDITTSDEEWQDNIEVKPRKKLVLPKLEKDFDFLFADADEC